MKRVLLIPVEGPSQVVDIGGARSGSLATELAALQELVGGDIEQVGVPDSDLAMFINAEGKIEGLPINGRATILTQVYRHGDAVVGPAVLFRYEGGEVVDEPDIAGVPEVIIKGRTS